MASHDIGYDADGNALDFTTIAGAQADGGVSAGDTLTLYYSDADQSPIWHEAPGDMSAKVLSVIGGLEKRGVILACNSGGTGAPVTISGVDLSGIASVVVRNLIIFASADATGVYFNGNTNVTYLAVEDCEIHGANYGVYLRANDNAHAVNTIVTSCATYGLLTNNGGSGVTLDFCTVVGGTTFNSGTGRGIYTATAATVRNCIAFGNAGNDFLGQGNSTGNNNASGDATAGDGNWSSGSNNQASLGYADIDFLRADSNAFDFRLSSDSGLIGDGVAVTGITDDIDGQTRANPPAIGCSEGVTFGAGGGLLRHPGMNGGLNG